MQKQVVRWKFSQFIVFFAFFIGVFASSPVWAWNELRNYKLGQWDFEVNAKYFTATSNYSRAGNQFQSLASGYSYTLYDFNLGGRWTPTTRWGIYSFAQVSSSQSRDLLLTRNNSGLNQIVAGADYLLFKAWANFISDVSVSFPFHRIDTGSNDVLISEGDIELTARMILQTKISIFDAFGFLGFTYRDEGRSSLLPYGTGAELDFHSWFLGADVCGYQTVLNDQYSGSPDTRELFATAKDGSTLRFYSVNPSILESNFWWRWSPGQSFSFQLGGGMTLTGTSTAGGWNIASALNYRFQTQQNPYSTPVERRKETELNRFHEETNDGVDQQLFQAPSPPPTPPVKKPGLTPEQRHQQIQKDLDKTEMKIELKPRKKKVRPPDDPNAQ